MASLNNTYAQRHYESALDNFEQGQYDKALQQIDKAIKNSPNNPDFYSTKGVFLHRMNDVAHAIDAYQEAIRVAPDHTFSHYNLGLIYMKLNKVVQAIQEWEAVIHARPRDTDAIFNIAVALSHLGKSKQAVPFYEKVIELDPGHVQAHQNLGVIFRDEGDFIKAKYHLKKLRELDSTYIEVVESEIIKCEEQEFLKKLEYDNQRISENLSEEDDSMLNNALIAVIEENFDKALEYAEKHLAVFPDDIQGRLIRGQALCGLSRNSDAIAVFMRIIVDSPECLDAMSHLGNIFLEMGEMEKALEYYEKLKKLDSDHSLIDENIRNIKNKLTGSVRNDD
ncbi:MAG: tetratricopeptide repeat protein [Candidatus Riflebacteria bacterium]|nr:tetratricopeptide repeat protein [Candidatus Riflebacteria bacterium]